MTDRFDACDENKAMVAAIFHFIECAARQPEKVEWERQYLDQFKVALTAFPLVIKGQVFRVVVRVYDDYLAPWVQGRVEGKKEPSGALMTINVVYDTSRVKTCDQLDLVDFGAYKYILHYPTVQENGDDVIIGEPERTEDREFMYQIYPESANEDSDCLEVADEFARQLAHVEQFFTTGKTVVWDVDPCALSAGNRGHGCGTSNQAASVFEPEA
jgi:hypothetical protein